MQSTWARLLPFELPCWLVTDIKDVLTQSAYALVLLVMCLLYLLYLLGTEKA